MNRRSFFTQLGLVAASFAILPAATTYARKWVVPNAECSMWIPNPAWETAPFEMAHLYGMKCPIFHHDPTINLSKCRFIRDESGRLAQVQQFIKA